jgi:ABC-2 type transport system permease protein
MSQTTIDHQPTTSPTARREVEAHPVTLTRVIRSETIKFRTLRSSWMVLGGAVLGMVAIGLIVAYNTRHLSPNLQPDDLTPSATLQGYYLGQLLIGALGVLFVSGEYSTGMIRSTLAAVPTRVPVLVAKAIVFTVITAVIMIVVSVIAFMAAQALIGHYRTGYSLADASALRVVLGTGAYLTLVGLVGGALGWIVRSTPGSLVAYFALMLVLPVLFGNVLGTWGKDIAEYLPSEAGRSFVSSLHQPHTLTPWTGLAVLVGWVILLQLVAVAQLRRRDA